MAQRLCPCVLPAAKGTCGRSVGLRVLLPLWRGREGGRKGRRIQSRRGDVPRPSRGGFALSPEGLGEFLTHSEFLSVCLQTAGLRPSSFLKLSAVQGRVLRKKLLEEHRAALPAEVGGPGRGVLL